MYIYIYMHIQRMRERMCVCVCVCANIRSGRVKEREGDIIEDMQKTYNLDSALLSLMAAAAAAACPEKPLTIPGLELE
jgi:hypothetical protein